MLKSRDTWAVIKYTLIEKEKKRKENKTKQHTNYQNGHNDEYIAQFSFARTQKKIQKDNNITGLELRQKESFPALYIVK